jgi:XPG domain containing
MGVQGFTRLLTNKGILSSAPPECCTVDLWRNAEANRQGNDDDEADTGAEACIRNVRPGSILLIDGPGLAFYLHSIAYSRWARRVTERPSSQRTCRDTVTLTAQQITLLLPHNLPLQVLVDLTAEFVSYLRDTHCLELQVYWDGPSSTEAPIDFKAATLKKRRARREMEWSNLQRYCNHGMVPTHQGAKQSCELCYEFPIPGMFLMVVRQTLEQLNVLKIVCDGEADPAMAKKACGQPDVYVVGQDSDFFFYRGIQYIPFNGFFQTATRQGKSPSKVETLLRAHVYTRQEIAESLGLKNGLMTELAVMLGNDYVDSTATLKAFDFDHDRLLIFLAAQEEGSYKHTSSTPSIEAAVQYSRVLYEHGCLEDLPMTDELESVDDNEDSEDDAMEMELGLSERSRSLLRHVHLQPYDASIRQAWLRSLQWIADETAAEDDMTVVQAKHLKVLQNPPLQRDLQNDLPELERPKWEDMLAAELIERCALRLLKQNAESELVPCTSPATLFDHAIFHHGISSTRIGQPVEYGEKETDPRNSPLQPLESGAQQQQPQPISLPIDEHRDSILESIRKYRVTIIHGETGCGKSSRVPVMLLEAPPPDPALAQVKLFISQPRRIAAKALVERVRSCEPKHGNKFALRMGHGWREYESSVTRAWFVTTGYLTRLLANHPEKFDGCTHLVKCRLTCCFHTHHWTKQLMPMLSLSTAGYRRSPREIGRYGHSVFLVSSLA